MNGISGETPLTISQRLTRSRYLCLAVDQAIQPILDEAPGSAASIPETLLTGWQAALNNALDLLTTIPTPMIYPPPQWAQFVQRAVSSIRSALQTLSGIPVAQPRIYPPQPGHARVDARVLQQVQADLSLAVQSLLAAERALPHG